MTTTNNKIEWQPLITGTINLEVQTKTIKPEGRLVYEYNPFRNYRLSENKYLYQGEYYTTEEFFRKGYIKIEKYRFTDGSLLTKEDLEKKGYSEKEPGLIYGIEYVYSWEDPSKNTVYFKYVPEYNVPENEVELFEKGQLVDFITDLLNFSLEHPVLLTPQASYDGSVNLVLNDGKNIPRLINSRFSPTGKNTYKIVDRKGTNDTNIYDEGREFDTDTSLYKRITKIPKIKYLGNSPSGNLKIGNYYFYFKLADVDDNETDFIGESGLVSVFIGFDYPSSIHTGNKNQNSYKAVKFYLDNLDESYDFVKVYYSRTTSENGMNSYTEYKKIDKKYAINNAGGCTVLITGFDNEVDITVQDINLHYNVVDSVKSTAVCQNMLFMANVRKPEIPYKELEDLSLRFLPYLHEEQYKVDIDEKYRISSSSKGYYDPKFIYEKVGYWGEELYRLGIVYILHNNELSPVFNIRGGIDINGSTVFSEYPVFLDNAHTQREYIQYNDQNNYIIPKENQNPSSNVKFENIKGVISVKPTLDTDTIYGLNIKVDRDTISELKKYIKGYFFVRQTRIPTILTQGVTLGVDQISHTPCIPTAGGFLNDLDSESLTKTHVSTSDITGVNYISEGFISRYKFYLKRKSSNLWKKIGTIAAVAVAVVAVVAATVVTAGGAGAALAAAATTIGATTASATAATALTAAAGALAGLSLSTAVTTAAVVGAVAVVGTTVAAAIQQARYNSSHRPKAYDGRNTPVPSGFNKLEEDSSRLLTHDFLERVIIKDSTKVKIQAILCPDYTVNLAMYNQIFTGNKHVLSFAKSQSIHFLESIGNYFKNDRNRHFYIPSYKDYNFDNTYFTFKVQSIGDNVKLANIDNLKFRSRAGLPEEAWKYECVGEDFKKGSGDLALSDRQINTDIIRGSFGPYLAFNDTADKVGAASIVNIYIPDYSRNEVENYIKIRMDDSSSYSAISDRLDLNDILDAPVMKGDTNINGSISHLVFRGDCYLCQFTHRLNRNFNDPSAPYNDEIVNAKSWKENYNTTSTEKQADINLGDVNAIQMGMWVTFKVRSSNNLNIRTLDGSNIDETEMTGHPKGYYPYHAMSVEGTFKHPDSQIYNRGFTKSVSDRWNVMTPDVPHIKNWFGTRIMYSDVHINDAFKNGFRVFQGLNYRDYTREYGEITKIVAFNSSLLCVFEHGIALVDVNERALASKGSGGNVYITSSTVLPENPKIISDSYGSQWADSILKVPGVNSQVVYGVDTIAKKIWVTDGNSINCISDGKVLEFLNNNITLGERELTPKLGIRNVKTVYNAFKKDVMFTFYDDTYGHDEKVWNLCYNETLLRFITFYSWVPSFMENINNVPFSFNRVVSKYLAKLGTSLKENSFSDGIVLDNIYCDINKNVPTIIGFNTETLQYQIVTAETDTTNISKIERYALVGKLHLVNRILPNENLNPIITYELLNKKNIFVIINDELYCKYSALSFNENGLYSEFYYRNSMRHSYADDAKYQYSLKELEKGIPAVITEYDENGKGTDTTIEFSISEYQCLPIFKNKSGKRLTLKYEDQTNPDNVVMLLDIKANISISTQSSESMSLDYYNQMSGYESGTTLIDAGYYESTVAVSTEWNKLFLSTDFWKHGLAGIFDISDDIYPTYWYGRQHPFEFEMLVINDPSVHKIFTNLEIIANKAKPESFHYEIVGESYDFAKDKVNMFIKLEALKALWQYNDAPISYNRHYLKCQPTYNRKSADFIKKYYYRKDSFNEVEDYYLSNISESEKIGKDFNHLAGAEIVYYPNRQEYRIWNHARAIDLNDQNEEEARSIIASNCLYKEDKWIVTINPIILCYKNEYEAVDTEGKKIENEGHFRLKLPLLNSQLPESIVQKCLSGEELYVPEELRDFELENSSWGNRKELDLKDKFMKVRIRYSGEELVVINALNTLYRESYG